VQLPPVVRPGWSTSSSGLRPSNHILIQEVSFDVAAKRVNWIKARPDFDVLFQLLNNLRVDEQRRFWIVYQEADEDACDIREDLGQEGMEVKIAFPMSHNASAKAEEYVK
jgi:hypothetical protein